MIILCLLLACAAVALYFNRRIEEALPIGVFGVMLLSYALALVSRLSRASQLSCIFCLFAAVLFFALYYKKIIRENSAPESISNIFSGYIIPDFRRTVCTQGMIVFLVWSVIIVLLFSSHFVTNWDDFNYWANFSKNIALVDGMVSGASSSTFFKDYTPIVQLLYFVVFKNFGGFNESLMFITTNILLTICLIPFISIKRDSCLLRSLVGILFPVAFMFQQLHCLGVDCILSVLFGYLLVLLFFEERRDLFYYAQLLMGISVLTLVKSTGIVCAFIVVLIAAVIEKRHLFSIFISVTAMLGSFFSWRMFCNRSGNTSYLTDRATSSLSSGGFLKLPEYTGEVLVRFAKNMLCFNLNGGKLGATPVLCLVLCGVILFLVMSNKSDSKLTEESDLPQMKESEISQRKENELSQRKENGISQRKVKGFFQGKSMGLVILAVGFIFYIASLLYTYLFVFDKWEALSLSSFDRYISVYLLAMLYLALYAFFEYGFFGNVLFEYSFLEYSVRNARGGAAHRKIFAGGFAIVLCLYMILSLNYPLLYNVFIPGGYERYYSDVHIGRAKVQEKLEKFYQKCPELRGSRFLIVNDTQDNELEKYQQYEAVPAVTFVLHIDEVSEKGADVYEEIANQMEDHSLNYAVIYSTGEIISR